MKLSTFLIGISISFVGCNGVAKDRLFGFAIADWFDQNEHTIYDEFLGFSQRRFLCEACDTAWTERSFEISDSGSQMGRLTRQIQAFAPGVKVIYIFNKTDLGKNRIMLSAGYDKSFSSAVDAVSRSLESSQTFKIQKFVPRDTDVALYGFDNLNTSDNNIRVGIATKELLVAVEGGGRMRNLEVFFPQSQSGSSINKRDEEYLIRQVFGEEILLKKTISVRLIDQNKPRNRKLVSVEAAVKLLQALK